MKKNDKWEKFHEALRQATGALIAITMFLLHLIFLAQLVWAHASPGKRSESQRPTRPPVVQQNDDTLKMLQQPKQEDDLPGMPPQPRIIRIAKG